MGKDEAIEKLKAYKVLLKDYFDIYKIYLFGSYSRDTAREDSDIDVAIIVNKLEGDYFSTVPIAWKLRREIDNRIEPLIIEKDNDPAGFQDEIIKYGVEII